jgi:hypothetical protein
MHTNTEHLSQIIVGLADLVREVRQHGRTARFDSRAPGLLEEAMQAIRTQAAQRAQAGTALREEAVAA